MTISRDEYLIRFDSDSRKLRLFYLVKESAVDLKTIFVSELAISELISVPLAEAERRIGERIVMMFLEVLKALHRGRKGNRKKKASRS